MRNPFPGLRPFEADEEHLFFGRETEVDELLRKLRTSRFVAVVGTSGSGKSSLVRSGVIPSLQGGFMAGAGSSWRIATFRPGDDPIGNLARALDVRDVLAIDADHPAAAPGQVRGDLAALAGTNAVLIEATLRRSSLGLIEAVRQARIPEGENLLVVVDQFEELFRFRRSGPHAGARDEASAFVRLLLTAAAQSQYPIFIIITMRSDFIGDCMDFRGLPEAVNGGLYLVGRMTRDGVRAAITGPMAVSGGSVAPRLVTRILNDLGDDHDQLPVVQHALMRTFEFWDAAHHDMPMDIGDYEAVGTTAHALSIHAEEAYLDCERAGLRVVAERVLKALTDTFSDPRGIRRPTSVADLSAIAGTTEAEVVTVVETFRRPGRSFVMPPVPVPLAGATIVDLAHESLMRCWERLIAWAEEDRAAAGFYARLSQAAGWHADGAAGLWRNPELELALQWRNENRPTAAWASRYDAEFDRAMAFLDASQRARDEAAAAAERQRRQTLKRTRYAAAVLALLLLAASTLAVIAQRESRRAGINLALAREAVDQSLSSADRSRARVGADTPDVEELRRDLLQKAERFYEAFMSQAPDSEASRRDLAMAHVRLGHIHRLMSRPEAAEREYRDAIGRLQELVARSESGDYRSALANAYNWLGEVLRPDAARAADAEQAYNRALELQRPLAAGTGTTAQDRQDLARTLYNRGILLSSRASNADRSRQDFQDAIAILEPLSTTSSQAAQELARAYNNLGSLLSADDGRAADVQALWGKAIAIDERLLAVDGDNREVKFELATFASNLAALLRDTGEAREADRRSAQALQLFDDLSRGAPALAIARADAHSLRGAILGPADGDAARREFALAVAQFASMGRDSAMVARADFHLRLGDLLLNLAALAGAADGPEWSPLLASAVSTSLDVVAMVRSPDRSEARMALDIIARVMPRLRGADRTRLEARVRELNRNIAGATQP